MSQTFKMATSFPVVHRASTWVVLEGPGFVHCSLSMNAIYQGWAITASGSIQENLQTLNILRLIAISVSAEVNLNRGLLLFPLEHAAHGYARPSQSDLRTKLIAHTCCAGVAKPALFMSRIS